MVSVMLYPCMFCVALSMDLFVLCVNCSTTMSAVDFERRLEGERGVEIWVIELWGVFNSSLLNPSCMIDVGPSWPPI